MTMLEQYRGMLFLALAFITYIMFTTWQEEHAKPSPSTAFDLTPEQQVPSPIDSTGGDRQANLSTEDNASLVPEAETKAAQQFDSTSRVSTKTTLIKTDVLALRISPFGDVVGADLLQFKEEPKSESVVKLLRQDHRTYVAQSGIFGSDANVPDKRNHSRAKWQLKSDQLQLSPGQDKLTVTFTWTSAGGVEYLKHYHLRRGSYDVAVSYDIINRSNQAINDLRMYAQLKRDQREPENQKSVGFGVQSYLGAAYSTHDNLYETYNLEDIEDKDLAITTTKGWVAFLQHYFVTAWIPKTEGEKRIYSRMLQGPEKNILVGMQSAPFSVPAGEKHSVSADLYVGPKFQDNLAEAADGLDRTIDYGFLFFIGQPIFKVMQFFHDGGWGIPGFGNWGIAIILVTLLVKLLLYPVFTAQYRSFAKMRKLQPKLVQLKERYGEDRQRMSQAMMELYRKEKVNPLGGCLPMLITMPVFLALYWVLLESVEIRHAEFAFWITDLSAKDPFFVLPILMGASMYLMQKMQPAPPTQDPMQAKIMQMLPIFMTALFLFFPSGLVLYWLVNNLLSIAQQVYVTKQFERETAK